MIDVSNEKRRSGLTCDRGSSTVVGSSLARVEMVLWFVIA